MSVLCSIYTVPQSCTKPFTPSTQRGKPNCLLAQRRDALLCHQTTFSTLHIELNHENRKQDWAQPWWSQAPNKKALDFLLRTETYRSQWTVTMSHSWWGLDCNSCEDIFIKHWWNFISFSSLWYSGTKGFFKRDLRRVTVCWIWCNLIHLHLFIFYLGRWYKTVELRVYNIGTYTHIVDAMTDTTATLSYCMLCIYCTCIGGHGYRNTGVSPSCGWRGQ